MTILIVCHLDRREESGRARSLYDAAMRLAGFLATILLAPPCLPQEITPDKLIKVREAAEQFKSRGMKIDVPTTAQSSEWASLTGQIAMSLQPFFQKRTLEHQAALDKWWTLYVSEEPVLDLDKELAFSSWGWRDALDTLTLTSWQITDTRDVPGMLAEEAAQEDHRVLQVIERETAWLDGRHWLYEVVENIKQSGLCSIYPNRRVIGPMPYARKDAAFVLINAHGNLLTSVEGTRTRDGIVRGPGFSGQFGFHDMLQSALFELEPEVKRIGGSPKVIRRDFQGLCAWLDRGRWSEKLNRAYLSETPPGHWADTAMTGLYEAGILIGRDARPSDRKR